ncbi:MAG: hypothetical protein M3082_12420 [Candidatus Dormibacteraeota bacterium]|nr:hypothetical protein [Candidatus Dormibacteraeota bacterium]
MTLRRAAITVQFVFFYVLSVATLTLAAFHTLGSGWWVSFLACLMVVSLAN